MDEGVVVVTGGASGIGLAAARELLGAGRRVLVADLAPANLEGARETLAAHGDAARFERLDVTDEAEVARVIGACDEGFGPVRGLVNSAGTGRDVPFLDTPAALLRGLLEVNLIGSFVAAQVAATRMTAHGGGAIVNITSVSGIRGNLGRAAYGASKGGVITLTKVMAVELAAHGIRVNAIAPGPVETPLVREMHTPASRGAWLATVPQRRYAEPAEIATAIAFLLDEARASFITGQVLAVDGGFTAAGLLAGA